MIKAIVFDFGNVLCGLDRMAFAREAARHSRLSAEELDGAIWGGELERDFETGKLDARSYFERMGRIAGFSSAYSFDDFVLDFRRIILSDPAGEAGLLAARDLGARTFVLSNTSWLHACLIFGNEILASVPELHVLSYKVGFMKPDPRIWMKLLEYSGLPAAECAYIDDIPAYCDAAASLGFRTFRYDRNVHDLSLIVRNMLE
jgi:putative hydrolase of the HAD superfamily